MTSTPDAIHHGGDGHGDSAHGHDSHGHSPHLAHHFESLQQQYASAKVGMWVFLGTEILMFGGLFTAYAVYRGTHPEVFLYAHNFLDTFWGATNTVILLLSSFTMAWAVRAAQLGQRTLLPVLLALTLLGGLGFMVIKSVEYTAKWNHHVWFGESNAFYTVSGAPVNPQDLEHAVEFGEEQIEAKVAGHAADVANAEGVAEHHGDLAEQPEHAASEGHGATSDHAGEDHAGEGEAETAAASAPASPVPGPVDHTLIAPTPAGPSGLAAVYQAEGYASEPYAAAAAAEAMHHAVTYDDLTERQKGLVSQFFQIYFLMTGLHGLHVLIGMGLITWILIRSLGGTFGPAYFTPVDLVGLYWHLVDLIWIFLFPLLYLIH